MELLPDLAIIAVLLPRRVKLVALAFATVQLVRFIWIPLVKLVPEAVIRMVMSAAAHFIVLYLHRHLLLGLIKRVHNRATLQQVLIKLLGEEAARLICYLLRRVHGYDYRDARLVQYPANFLTLAGADDR